MASRSKASRRGSRYPITTSPEGQILIKSPMIRHQHWVTNLGIIFRVTQSTVPCINLPVPVYQLCGTDLYNSNFDTGTRCLIMPAYQPEPSPQFKT